MNTEKSIFPDPLEEIKPQIDLFPRKVSIDYDDLENEKAKEISFQKSALYNPVQIKNFEQWNKEKLYSNYFIAPTDVYDMYKGVMPNGQNRKMSSTSTDSSNVIDTLF